MRFNSFILTVFIIVTSSGGCSLSFGDYVFDGLDEDAGSQQGEAGASADGRDAADRDASSQDGASRDAGVDSGEDAATECITSDDCDDGDPCNGEETCGDDQTCEDGQPVECPDSDEPCRVNVCVNDDGTGVCELQPADDGTACNDDDDTTTPQDECRLDFQCDSGDCVAQTVETCEAGQCGQLAGCEAGTGCVYEPEPDTTSCDDDDPCTEQDHCSGTDNTCAGLPKDCDDSVDCTVDSCDEDGNCENAPDDDLCISQCQIGTCDAEADCQFTAGTDFTACDDNSSSTAPDFCYLGNCLGGNGNTPSATCAVGSGCGCSDFGIARDLEYVGNEYVALIDATQTAEQVGCTDGSIAIVYDVDPSGLTPYGTGNAVGALSGTGRDLHSVYALGDVSGQHRVGILDVTNREVDWSSSNYLGAAISSGTPNLGSAASIATHGTGVVLGGTMHFWLVGQDISTNTTGRIIRCEWTNCILLPCPDPVPTCVYETGYSNVTYVAMRPYTHSVSEPIWSTVYDGAVAATTLTNNTTYDRRIFADGPNKDYGIYSISRDDAEGLWSGLTRHGASGTLLYGQQPNNLTYCDDTDQDGEPTCTPLTGLPNQDSRYYFDATTTPNGGLVVIGTDCAFVCTSKDFYLLMLPAGADARDAASWTEYYLSSWNGFGGSVGQTPAEVAAGSDDSIYVIGHSSPSLNPYLWVFAP